MIYINFRINYQKTTKVILPEICFISQMKVSPWVTAKQLHFNFSFISVFLFLFLFQFLHVFICFQEKTFQIQLFITAMTIPMVIPTVLAKMGHDLIVVVLLYLNMGLELWVRQKTFFYLFIYFTLALRFLIFHNSIFSCISLRMIIPCAQL